MNPIREVLINNDLLGYICDYNTDEIRLFFKKDRVSGLIRRWESLIYARDIVHYAVKYNRIDILEKCKKQNLSPIKWREVLSTAISRGNLQVAQWLLNNDYNCEWDIMLMQTACATGNMEIAKWVHSNFQHSKYSYDESVSFAILINNLTMIKWLHETCGAKIRKACCYNINYFTNMDIIIWLDMNAGTD